MGNLGEYVTSLHDHTGPVSNLYASAVHLADTKLAIPTDAAFTGFYFMGKHAREHFFSVTCPCGVTQTCAPEDFPTVDTPHKCGKPNHWFAQFKE